MDYRDVVIVGGGPAGSTCAWRLRLHGVSTVVLEAQEFPRTKLCAGWITPRVLRDLEFDAGRYPHGILKLDEIRVAYFGSRKTHRWTIPTKQFSIRRFEFDWWLLQRSGVPVRRHKVRQVRKETDGFVIDDEYSCRYLVGAGGTLCPVYATLFKDLDPRPTATQVCTLEEEFAFPGRDGSCRLWFMENGLPGYSWYVPKANGWVNIGIGALAQPLRQCGLSLRTQWGLFTTRLTRDGLIGPREYHPGGYSYYMRTRTGIGQCGNCFVIGDAAGLATRDLAEGIGPAIESGIRAANAIASGSSYSPEGITSHSWPGFLSGFFRSLF